LKKYLALLAQGIGLGLLIGLCLAGAVGLVFRAVHSGEPDFHPERAILYLLIVGGMMGFLGGWCFALQMLLGNLLSSLFIKISELVPLSAASVGEDWAKKMETFFTEVLKPMPAFFRKVVHFLFVARFQEYDRLNEALETAKGKEKMKAYSPQWMSQVALGFFLKPLWVFFYITYAVLFLISCIFWSIPFFR
jgi:hypothetical protein